VRLKRLREKNCSAYSPSRTLMPNEGANE
jgi:hypothetical protein